MNDLEYKKKYMKYKLKYLQLKQCGGMYNEGGMFPMSSSQSTPLLSPSRLSPYTPTFNDKLLTPLVKTPKLATPSIETPKQMTPMTTPKVTTSPKVLKKIFVEELQQSISTNISLQKLTSSEFINLVNTHDSSYRKNKNMLPNIYYFCEHYKDYFQKKNILSNTYEFNINDFNDDINDIPPSLKLIENASDLEYVIKKCLLYFRLGVYGKIYDESEMEKRLDQDILNIKKQHGGAWVDGKISEGNFDLALRIIYDSNHPIPQEDDYSEVYVAYNNLSNNSITKNDFIEKLEEVEEWVSKNGGLEVSEYEFTEMLLKNIDMIEQNIIFCKNDPTEITYNMTKQEYAYFEILLWMDSLHDYWFGSKEQTTTPYGKFGEYKEKNNGLTFINLFLNKFPDKELDKALKDINSRISGNSTEVPIWQSSGESLPERTYNGSIDTAHFVYMRRSFRDMYYYDIQPLWGAGGWNVYDKKKVYIYDQSNDASGGFLLNNGIVCNNIEGHCDAGASFRKLFSIDEYISSFLGNVPMNKNLMFDLSKRTYVFKSDNQEKFRIQYNIEDGNHTIKLISDEYYGDLDVAEYIRNKIYTQQDILKQINYMQKLKDRNSSLDSDGSSLDSEGSSEEQLQIEEALLRYMIHSKAAGDLGQILSSGHKIKNIKIPNDLYEPVFLSGDTSALTTAMYLTKKIMSKDITVSTNTMEGTNNIISNPSIVCLKHEDFLSINLNINYPEPSDLIKYSCDLLEQGLIEMKARGEEDVNKYVQEIQTMIENIYLE